jgi:hypothetical protein
MGRSRPRARPAREGQPRSWPGALRRSTGRTSRRRSSGTTSDKQGRRSYSEPCEHPREVPRQPSRKESANDVELIRGECSAGLLAGWAAAPQPALTRSGAALPGLLGGTQRTLLLRQSVPGWRTSLEVAPLIRESRRFGVLGCLGNGGGRRAHPHYASSDGALTQPFGSPRDRSPSAVGCCRRERRSWAERLVSAASLAIGRSSGWRTSSALGRLCTRKVG